MQLGNMAPRRDTHLNAERRTAVPAPRAAEALPPMQGVHRAPVNMGFEWACAWTRQTRSLRSPLCKPSPRERRTRARCPIAWNGALEYNKQVI